LKNTKTDAQAKRSKIFGDFLKNENEESEQLLIEKEMRRRKREAKKCVGVKEKMRID
jgi:hypothetical protein